LLFRGVLTAIKNRIYNNLKQACKHLGQHVFHTRVVYTDVWICINFDKPNSEVLINHVIKTKQFKSVSALVGVQSLLTRQETVDTNIFHPGQHVAFEVQVVLRKCFIEILLKLLKRKSISFLMLAISILVFDLKTVICEMREFIVHVVKPKLAGRSSDIAYVVEVKLHVACGHTPHSDVKLPVFVQQWLFNVFLNHPVAELDRAFQETTDVV
jgi:hypothetical protein